MRKSFLYILIFFFYSSLYSYGTDFSPVDAVINTAIQNKAFPGAQLVIGNSDGIIYSQNYGTYSYDAGSAPVTKQSLFDLASLTKVVATTTAIMQLYDLKKLSLDDRAGYYVPEFNNNGKEAVTIKNLLLHNSGLKAWIPFYKTCKSRDEALNVIYNTGLDYPTGSQFVYSDLNAVMLGLIVEKVSGMTLDNYCAQNIFSLLGMEHTYFNLPENLRSSAMPTENDTYWRRRQLQGEVHDETAAILGGVSGNAGLFSTAEDLSRLVGMLAKGGQYYNAFTRNLQNETLVSSETVNLFTTLYTGLPYSNTRALGWDTKPEQTGSARIPCGENISSNCFGHTGYTGTSIWYDKDRNVYVIFLTNRVYPNRNNNAIRDIRPEVHNKVFEITDKMN